ncbi:hypothetical protein [Lentzea sp. NBRC 102530]|uniref:hypothetical protein n=1 Tax=Lentzea sp. NBRC 102530 TaxID=3032201 RepID=UPI0024A137D5|nr:hypothetical protein [Lentzea sp. NBRC 102530]GLY55320.1 hypothetical protein Lesp01_89750 [Lentzea sp. NBRC 102530]
MLSDNLSRIFSLVQELRNSERSVHRDQTMDKVRLVRRGNIDELFPDLFADDMPKSIVANLVDTAARDTAELMAPLPALACASGNMTSTADELRASKKNKIGAYYWTKSRVAEQMIDFADSYNSYAFGVFEVVPDFEHNCPRIRQVSPFGVYYLLDSDGETRVYVKVTKARARELAALFPEHATKILFDKYGTMCGGDAELELVRYTDRKQTIIFLPSREHCVLQQTPNLISRVPIVIAERPDLEDTPRGQYDDVIWVQLARSVMALYQLKGTQESVEAPLAVPDDVQMIPFGPDAVIRTQNPQAVRRVSLDLSRDVYMLGDQLDREMKTGSRYPDSRTGGVQGNIITGRGVQALQGTIDTQIQTAQTKFARALETATSLCFEMDAVLWSSSKKTIQGVLTGRPFELTYTPAKDIGTSWTCKVTYGFAAGLTPSQAVVMMLQLRGDSLIGRDTVRRQLPFDIDPEEEQRSVDTEQMEDSLKQGFSAMLQAIGPMAAQGQDPIAIVRNAAKAIELRSKGKSLTDAILTALTPPEPPPGAEIPAQPGAPAEEMPPGLRENGLMEGQAYGQAGMAPGGMPAISSLMAELRGDQPRMTAGVSRKRALGVG